MPGKMTVDEMDEAFRNAHVMSHTGPEGLKRVVDHMPLTVSSAHVRS
jgi:hypothetical protein